MEKEEETKGTVQKPEKKKIGRCWWVGCGCGCLSLFVVVILVVAYLFINKPATILGIETPFSELKKSESTSSQNSEMTHDELVNYFVATATYDAAKERVIPTTCWKKKKVSLKVSGTISFEGSTYVDEFITKFNRNSSSIKLERNDLIDSKNADIIIEYGNSPSNGKMGRARYEYDIDSCEIYNSLIQIGNEADMEISEVNFLRHIINHELFHSIGFAGHSKTDSCNLMSGKTCGDSLNANEEKLIWMMYSSGLPPCSNESEIRNFFKNKEIK